MEEEATKIMSCYCSGDYKAVEKAFKQMDEGLVQHAVERARELGNSAFSKGAYRQALQYYNEALAGEQISRKPSLLSNRSACYLLLRDPEKALQDARMCIRLEPKYAKGWYRAARVLFETGKYSGAEAAFKVSRRHEVDVCKQKELDVWVERARKLAHRAKLIDRVTVDYSRFDTIEDPDTTVAEASVESDAIADGCSVELSDKLSKDQKRQLELFLTGKVENDSTSEKSMRHVVYHPSTAYSNIPCYAEVFRREGPKVATKCHGNTQDDDRSEEKYRAEKIALELPVALCKFLQLTTEVKEPKKLSDSLEDAVLPAFVDKLQFLLEGLLRDESRARTLDDISWFFLGCGTCVPLVTAAHTIQDGAHLLTSLRQSEPDERPRGPTEPAGSFPTQTARKKTATVLEATSRKNVDLSKERPSNLKPISACTVFLSDPISASAHAHNQIMRGLVHMQNAAERMLEINKVEHLVNLLQQRVEKIDCAGESADELDCTTKDMLKPAQLLVIDPSLLDEALLGRQVVPYVRDARKQLCVAKPTVFPSRATVFVQAFSIHLPRQATPYNWDAMETAARWSPYAEPMSLKVLSENSYVTQEEGQFQYGDAVTALSRPQAAFTFSFDCPLDELDVGLPLEREKELVLECTKQGAPNALVVWYQLQGAARCPAATTTENRVVTDSRCVIIDCAPETESTPRIMSRIVSPRESPSVTRKLAIPRYFLDNVRDPYLAELYQQAIARVVAAQLKQKRLRLKKFEQLSPTPASDLPPPPGLSVLCVGGAPAPLPALTGHALAAELVKTPGFAPSAWQQKQTSMQTFHITTIDSWPGAVKTCKRVVIENAHLLLESCLAPTPPVPKEEKWKPIAELTERLPDDTSALFAASKRSVNRCANDASHEAGHNLGSQPMGRSEQKALNCDPLLKIKIKERFTCLQKDVRQVKPPAGEEDTTSLLTLAEVYRLPPGADLKAHLEQAEAADPTGAAASRLPALASICVCGLFDNGCLGEGILPLSKRVRCVAVLLEVGRRSFGNVNVEIWRTYRYLPDYAAIDLDEETCKLLSNPFLVWDFDLTPSTLIDMSAPIYANGQKEFKIPITQGGELNAVAFWFELEVDEFLTISTRPTCIAHSQAKQQFNEKQPTTGDFQAVSRDIKIPHRGPQRNTEALVCAQTSQTTKQTKVGDLHVLHQTKAWKQAVQMQQSFKVAAGCAVAVVATHDSTKMLFRTDPTPLESQTDSRPLYDSSWMILLEKQQALSAGWMKALCGEEGNQNSVHADQATEAALRIAADAGRQRPFCIDPQEAAAFFMTLFY